MYLFHIDEKIDYRGSGVTKMACCSGMIV